MYMPSESWYINNENLAANLSGKEGSPLKIDIATFNPGRNDNFAYEMWFRGIDPETGSVIIANDYWTTLIGVHMNHLYRGVKGGTPKAGVSLFGSLR